MIPPPCVAHSSSILLVNLIYETVVMKNQFMYICEKLANFDFKMQALYEKLQFSVT